MRGFHDRDPRLDLRFWQADSPGIEIAGARILGCSDAPQSSAEWGGFGNQASLRLIDNPTLTEGAESSNLVRMEANSLSLGPRVSFFWPVSKRLATALVFLTCLDSFALEPIGDAGTKLSQALDAMHVEEHWIAGAIVDWKSGDPTGKPVTDSGKHTHCSQFVAAACERLGIYILRPPEHSAVLLANAQYDWLSSAKAREKGWSPVPDGRTAQDLANKGHVVVAVCKNPDPKKSGHIAIVRPGQRSTEQLAAEGPTIIQAGGHNWNSTSLKKGFANHRGAFLNGEIRFFEHAAAK